MSKIKAAPIDWATEIDRPGIAEMAGTGLAKVGFVTLREKWGFPLTHRKGPRQTLLYPLAAVKKWLETNDLKAMTFIAEDRAPVRVLAQAAKGIDNAAVATLKIGIKPPRFSRHSPAVTVHVPERNDYTPPDSRLTRFSNNADHRISGSF